MKIVLCLLLIAVPAVAQAPQDPITVTIGDGPHVTVHVPNFSKAQLNDMVSIMFSKGDETAARTFRDAFTKASGITLIVTTERQP